MEAKQKLENGQILLKVEKNIYSHEAILSTAYKFADICYIQVSSIDSNHYGVVLSPKNTDADMASCVNEFFNELIDQQIRCNLDKSNRSIKELIIKKAFFPFEDNE